MPKCRFHPRERAVGYCSGCGLFGCEKCLRRGADDRWYCLPCARMKRVKLSGQKSDTDVYKVHLQLVARFLDGRKLKGTSYKLDPGADSFHVITPSGTRHNVRFRDLKCVEQVADLSGESPAPRRRSAAKQRGQEIEVRFRDGEVLKGHCVGHYDASSPRFRVIPPGDDGNCICILVERAATESVRLGQQLVRHSQADLIATPLRRALLSFYRNNSRLISPVRAVAGKLGVTVDALEGALEPFYLCRLIRKRKMGEEVQLEFLPPPNRDLHAFVREHAPKTKSPVS